MSKKLLIAVLTLGMIFAISGAVISSDNPTPEDRINLREQFGSSDRTLTTLPQFAEGFFRPSDPQVQAISPSSIFPPPYFCDWIDYSGGNFSFFQAVPTSHPVFYQNMRFTSPAGYECTLLTASVAVYPPGFLGTPDMEILVWDDDGSGFPGVLRASTTIPYASLPTGIAYVDFDVSSLNLIYSDGEEYHIGVNCPNGVSGTTELAILMDDGTVGTGRHSIWYDAGPFWTTWATDYNFVMGADFCCGDIPYQECYRQSYDCNAWYIWPQPDDYGDDYFNMRMSVSGPESLMAIGVAMYMPAASGAADLDLFVWGGAGGFPDLFDEKVMVTIPNGSIIDWATSPPGADYNHYDVSASNLVFREDFFVGWSTNEVSDPTGVLVGMSDDASCGTLRSSEYWGLWGLMANDWGEDFNFMIYADMCKDEFAVCMNILNTSCDPYWIYSLPSSSGSGRVGAYEKIEPIGLGCRLEKINIQLYDTGDPWLFSFTSMLRVYDTDANDLPGNLLAELEIGPGTSYPYEAYPGTNTFDLLALGIDVKFDEPLWIGVHTNHPDPTGATDPIPDYFALGDDDGCGGDHAVVYYTDGTYVRYTGSHFFFDADVCCIPPPERACTDIGPGEDWTSGSHDQRRTAASDNEDGDARGQQTLIWAANDAAGIIYGRPVIYDGVLVVPFNDKLIGYDLANGTVLYTISGMPTIGSGLRSSLTASAGRIFFGGGNAMSFNCYDIYNGTEIWSRGALHAEGLLNGNTIYNASVILDVDGTEVVFTTTTAGGVYALDAATGNNFTGWTPNPLLVDGDLSATLSTNGTDVLYVGTDGAYGTGYGTLYAIDAATGTVNWSMGEAELLGHDIDGDDGTVTTEWFRGPIGVDFNGDLYVQSAFNTEEDGAPSGARYRIDASGNVIWGSDGRWTYFAGPVIDANMVYFTALRAWTAEKPATAALSKITGSVLWESDPLYAGMNFVEGGLECTLNEYDRLYLGNLEGQFLVLDTETGLSEFEYNFVANTSARGLAVAIGVDRWVVLTTRQGDIFALNSAAKADRARLRINTFEELASVPFFSPNPHPIQFDDVFMNNGPLNLFGTLSIDETAPALIVNSVNPRRIKRLADAADAMVDYSYESMAKAIPSSPNERDVDFDETAYSKGSYSNTAAYGPPNWFIDFNGSDVFDLGDQQAHTVEMNVIGYLVTRGPHRAYVTISSNDQYYLNDAAANPTIILGVLGGCLEAQTDLIFGSSEQNVTTVHNTGETGNQLVTHWEIDGDAAAYWQGGLFFATAPVDDGFGNDRHRLAWNTESWHGADPEDFWNSLLPDPSYGTCEPNISPAPVTLVYMDEDGDGSYDAVEGNYSVVKYIDSVVAYDCGGPGSWSWDAIDCPFDNDLTLGLMVDEYMYGAINEALLNNFVVYKLNITNRNPVKALSDIHFGGFNDWDLESNGSDLFTIDLAHNISWGASCEGVDITNTKVAGFGKIPMDDPMWGVRTMDADQSMWHADYIALDSMYYWMTNEPGVTVQLGVENSFPCVGTSADRDQWISYGSHDFGARETYALGIYMFQFVGDVTDAAFFQDFAKLVNQYAGFDRGDINRDGAVNLADVVALHNVICHSGVGPLFEHSADVNNSGGPPDQADIMYLAEFWFNGGPAPVGAWVLPEGNPDP